MLSTCKASTTAVSLANKRSFAASPGELAFVAFEGNLECVQSRLL